MQPFYFLVTFWGQEFAYYLCRYAIPSLLAPGNIGSLREPDKARFLVCTTEQDWEHLNCQSAFTTLAQKIKVELVANPEKSPGEQKYHRMSRGHALLAQRCYDSGAIAINVNPDSIYPDGSVATVQALAEAGKRVVLGTAIRFDMEGVDAELTANRIIQENAPLTISKRGAVDIGLRNLHPESKASMWTARNFGRLHARHGREHFLTCCMWPVPDENGVIIITHNWAPFMVDYGTLARHDVGALDGRALDGNYIFENFWSGDFEGIHICRDSDELFMFGLTSRTDMMPPEDAGWWLKMPFLSQRAKGRILNRTVYDPSIDAMRRKAYQITVYWHSREINDRWQQTIERVAELIDRYVAQPPRVEGAGIMLRLLKNGIQRIASAGGYSVVKARTVAESLGQVQILRKENEGLRKRVRVLQGEVMREMMRDLPNLLTKAATNVTQCSPTEDRFGEREGLAEHYRRCAAETARYRAKADNLPFHAYPDDDQSLEYAIKKQVYVLKPPGSEVEASPHPPCPWQDLINDPNCGVFLVLGASNASNCSDAPYSPRGEVYSLDFLRMKCTRARDPLPGASGLGGSVWSRLGDLLLERDVFQRVLFVPLGQRDAFLGDWLAGGDKYDRVLLALSRLSKSLCSAVLPFSAVLWQQGEAEANHTQMSTSAYQARFYDFIAELRRGGVFSPVFVALATICEVGEPPYRNRDAIRRAQKQIPDPARGIFPGPDADLVSLDERFDRCHFSSDGAQHCAELWAETLQSRQWLLKRIYRDLRSV